MADSHVVRGANENGADRKVHPADTLWSGQGAQNSMHPIFSRFSPHCKWNG